MVQIPVLGSKPYDLDKADTTFLEMASRGPVVLPIAGSFSTPEEVNTFERALQMSWIVLWDVRPAQLPGTNAPLPCRIFRLTSAGSARLKEIQERAAIAKRLLT